MPETNPTTDPAVAVLIDLVRTIEAPGGVISFPNGTFGCAGDPEWIDLADVAMKAHAVLKERGIDATLTVKNEEEDSENID